MLFFFCCGSLRRRIPYSTTNISRIKGKERKLAKTDQTSMPAKKNRTLETRLIASKNSAHDSTQEQHGRPPGRTPGQPQQDGQGRRQGHGHPQGRQSGGRRSGCAVMRQARISNGPSGDADPAGRAEQGQTHFSRLAAICRVRLARELKMLTLCALSARNWKPERLETTRGTSRMSMESSPSPSP